MSKYETLAYLLPGEKFIWDQYPGQINRVEGIECDADGTILNILARQVAPLNGSTERWNHCCTVRRV